MSSIRTVIGVDTGNRLMKTANYVFPSGLSEWREEQLSPDKLFYQGRYYTHADQNTPYKKNKAQDNTYFILTLIAIAKELEKRYGKTGTDQMIDLALGLPPGHFKSAGIKDSYISYFSHREPIDFIFNGVPRRIMISKVHVYPQAYAAVATRFDEITKLPETYLFDGGGYTLDILLLKKGLPNMSVCKSFDYGMIPLYSSIRSDFEATYDYSPSNTEIESVLRSKRSLLPEEGQGMILEIAGKYVDDIFLKLREEKISLQYKPTYVMGGGGMMMRPFIEQGQYLAHGTYITDIKANAKGYEFLLKNQVSRDG